MYTRDGWGTAYRGHCSDRHDCIRGVHAMSVEKHRAGIRRWMTETKREKRTQSLLSSSGLCRSMEQLHLRVEPLGWPVAAQYPVRSGGRKADSRTTDHVACASGAPGADARADASTDARRPGLASPDSRRQRSGRTVPGPGYSATRRSGSSASPTRG